MKSKRIISLILIFAIFSCLFAVSASAALTEVAAGVSIVSGFITIANQAWEQGTGSVDFIHGLFDDDFCADSPSEKHNFVKQTYSDNGSMVTGYVCSYCGVSADDVVLGNADCEHSWVTITDGNGASHTKCEKCGVTGYSGRSGKFGSYQNYVETLPATEFNSDNSILYRPTLAECLCHIASESKRGTSSAYIHKFGYSSDPQQLKNHISAGLDDYSIPFTTDTLDLTDLENDDVRYVGFSGYNDFLAPMDGMYYLLDKPAVIGSYYDAVSQKHSYSVNWQAGLVGSFNEGDEVLFVTQNVNSSGTTGVNAGNVLPCYSFPSGITYYDLTAIAYTPYYRIVPTESELANIQNIYDQSTRMGNVNFDYGVTNTDNSITTTNNYIVNETTNTYTNPATGDSQTISSWTYDYTDRSYDLTLENGDTTTVTYGDEYVTITENTTTNEGDTITNNYIVYYVIQEPAADDPDPSPSPSAGTGSGGSSGTSTGSSSRVFQNYGATITQSYGNDGHGGTDCIPTSGTADTVIAHSEGDVVWVQTGQENNQGSTGDASYGNAVKIQHSNGYYTLYAHLATVEVSEGDHVYQGQPLGQMGNTGNSYGAHLHFEVRTNSDTRINSDPYLNADLPGLSTDDGASWWSNAMSRLGQILGSSFIVEIFSSIGEAFGTLWGWLPPEIVVVFTIGVTFLVAAAVMKFFL